MDNLEKLEAEIKHLRKFVQTEMVEMLDTHKKDSLGALDKLSATILLQVTAALTAPNHDLEARVEELEAKAEAEINRRRERLSN